MKKSFPIFLISQTVNIFRNPCVKKSANLDKTYFPLSILIAHWLFTSLGPSGETLFFFPFLVIE